MSMLKNQDCTFCTRVSYEAGLAKDIISKYNIRVQIDGVMSKGSLRPI